MTDSPPDIPADSPAAARADTRPYSLEISPPARAGGSYRWTIRKDGKLYQRSDRHHPSEAKAREQAEAEIERLLRDR